MKATGPGLNETSVVAAGACWVADIVCCARSGGWPCGCRSLARTRTPWPRGTWHCTRCREGVETRSVLYSYTLLPHTWHLRFVCELRFRELEIHPADTYHTHTFYCCWNSKVYGKSQIYNTRLTFTPRGPSKTYTFCTYIISHSPLIFMEYFIFKYQRIDS